MTPAGWVVLCVSVGAVCVLCAFCFYRILTEKPHAHHAPLDIETKDAEE
jgi:hypothetical protein